MLQAPEWYTEPESFLVFGVNSAGKTKGWATIRKWYEITQTPGHFHVISPEYRHAMRTRQAYLNGELGNNFDSNATIYEVTNYETLLEVSEKVKKAGLASAVDTPYGPRSPDYAIVDSIGYAKTWARDVWFLANRGMTYSEFVRSGKKMSEIKPADWIDMNGIYRDWINPNILMFPGHKYATAHMKEISTEGSWAEKKKDILRMFGPHGVKPDGDDDLGHAFNSVFLMNRARDSWRITTVDDPEREYLDDAPLNDFVLDILCGVAGWQMT